MAAVSLAEAQEKLEELIDRVARGETVEILRDGELVAQLTATTVEGHLHHTKKAD